MVEQTSAFRQRRAADTRRWRERPPRVSPVRAAVKIVNSRARGYERVQASAALLGGLKVNVRAGGSRGSPPRLWLWPARPRQAEAFSHSPPRFSSPIPAATGTVRRVRE